MTVTLSAKPSTTPNWNTGGANRTTPSGAKQILGWAVGESPSSAFFNWWMNLEYQWQQWNEDAIDALNAGKADLDGDTFTGPMIFDGTVTINDNVEIGGSVIVDQSNGSTWLGDFVPETHATYNLGGSPSNTFSALYCENVVACTTMDAPGSQQDVVTLSQRKATTACGKQTSATSTASLGAKHFNVDTIVRTIGTAGEYTITFDQAVDDDAALIVTPAFGSGSAARCAWGRIAAGGGTATVYTFVESGGTLTLGDAPFSFVVIGSPDTDT